MASSRASSAKLTDRMTRAAEAEAEAEEVVAGRGAESSSSVALTGAEEAGASPAAAAASSEEEEEDVAMGESESDISPGCQRLSGNDDLTFPSFFFRQAGCKD